MAKEKLTFAQIEAMLLKGESPLRRLCGVCREPIRYILRVNKPFLSVCSCREAGKRAEVKLTWKELEQLVESG